MYPILESTELNSLMDPRLTYHCCISVAASVVALDDHDDLDPMELETLVVDTCSSFSSFAFSFNQSILFSFIFRFFYIPGFVVWCLILSV